jgi:hypothetical protein
MLASLAVVAAIASQTGCSLFQEQLSPSLKADLAAGEAAPAAPEAKLTVEIHPQEGQPMKTELPLTGEMHIQEALEKSGAAKKYNRMFIELARPLPAGGWHKMKLEYDHASDRVPPEFDYHVLPGDRLIVTEDTSSVFTDLLDRSLSPLGIKPPGRKKTASDMYEIRG